MKLLNETFFLLAFNNNLCFKEDFVFILHILFILHHITINMIMLYIFYLNVQLIVEIWRFYLEVAGSLVVRVLDFQDISVVVESRFGQQMFIEEITLQALHKILEILWMATPLLDQTHP